MELLRDPIRLSFAFIGPAILMFAFGYGITFDVENLKYAAFDQDQTPASRRLLESFSGSHYFSERPPISSTAELEQRMQSGELAVVVEVPPGFGRDLRHLHPPIAVGRDDRSEEPLDVLLSAERSSTATVLVRSLATS